MSIILKNSRIELLVDLPEDNYQLSRFDWTGKIVGLKFDSVCLTTSEEKSAKNSSFLGQGFYNEFGIKSPLGFIEAKEGEWFHKIGIGLLKKQGKVYDFNKPYEMKPAVFKTTTTASSIILSCTAQTANGYGYVLTKKIVLLADGFKVLYVLKNTGSKVIETSEYCHNFLAMEYLSSDRYSLNFSFIPAPSRFNETINPNNYIGFKMNKVSMLKGLNQTFYFSNLSGSKLVSSKWELQDHLNKVSISEQGDFETRMVNLWGAGHVVSPELFVAIELAPHKSFSWQRTYSIRKL